jgi:hypothetical protein
MSATFAATISQGVSIQDPIAVGSTIGQGYTIPYQPADDVLNYLGSNGAGTAGYAFKFAFKSASAAAALSDSDLTSIPCDDGSTGFTHVRERIIYNDDATHTLNVNCSVANGFDGRWATGTSIVLTIQPKSSQRMPPIPLAANGYLVAAGFKIIEVDPGGNTIAYRLLVIGD